MPCQEWVEFQPSRSSTKKTQEAERASYLSLGDLYPCLHSQGRSYKKYPKGGAPGQSGVQTTSTSTLHLLTSLMVKEIKKKKKKKANLFRFVGGDAEAQGGEVTCPSQRHHWD